jgi:hypothetical protein
LLFTDLVYPFKEQNTSLSRVAIGMSIIYLIGAIKSILVIINFTKYRKHMASGLLMVAISLFMIAATGILFLGEIMIGLPHEKARTAILDTSMKTIEYLQQTKDYDLSAELEYDKGVTAIIGEALVDGPKIGVPGVHCFEVPKLYNLRKVWKQNKEENFFFSEDRSTFLSKRIKPYYAYWFLEDKKFNFYTYKANGITVNKNDQYSAYVIVDSRLKSEKIMDRFEIVLTRGVVPTWNSAENKVTNIIMKFKKEYNGWPPNVLE